MPGKGKKFFQKKVLPDNPDSPEYAKDREGLQTQIRSSAWLEHYTDNVGVSSSNLLGSTNKSIAVSREIIVVWLLAPNYWLPTKMGG